MGYVVYVSFPLVIILLVLVSFGCYAMGLHKGREEGRVNATRGFGVNVQSLPPITPPGGGGVNLPPNTPPLHPPPQYSTFPSPPPNNPNPSYMKQQNGMAAV